MPRAVFDLAYFLDRLPKCETQPLTGPLIRKVRWAALQSHTPPNSLYSSGKPGRYNPAGVECLYASEDHATAQLEYEDALDPALMRDQPVVEYCAKVHLVARPDLDLLNKDTLHTLGLVASDPSDPDIRNVFVEWRKHQPVATQSLGGAIVQLGAIAAIRYPSNAALRRGGSGVNVVLFKRCVRDPDSVEIVGPTGPLQRWP